MLIVTAPSVKKAPAKFTVMSPTELSRSEIVVSPVVPLPPSPLVIKDTILNVES